MEGGRLRALAVTSPQPSPAGRNTPTVAATVAGYAVESWYGLYVPAGTPGPVVARLTEAAKKAARSSEFAKRIEPEGLVIDASDPPALDRYVKGEIERWRKIVVENRIQPD